jgi:hypothetical protein
VSESSSFLRLKDWWFLVVGVGLRFWVFCGWLNGFRVVLFSVGVCCRVRRRIVCTVEWRAGIGCLGRV